MKAKQVANVALKTRTRTSKDVKDIGLPSAISNQILKKYSSNKKLKKISKVNITVPGQGIKVDKEKRYIRISCLKLLCKYHFRNDFEKVNQIEIDREYICVSITIKAREKIKVDGFVGVDINTTGHSLVAASPKTSKVLKFGKRGQHIHKKYSHQRKKYQKQRKFGKAKQLKDRERRIIKDEAHKATTKLVRYAQKHNLAIKLEDLTGIRKRAKTSDSFKYLLNSWSYYMMGKMIEYKAKLLGIPVEYVDPRYTSQMCSRCSQKGSRYKKMFKCQECGHVDHADVNASFTIALRHGAKIDCIQTELYATGSLHNSQSIGYYDPRRATLWNDSDPRACGL